MTGPAAVASGHPWAEWLDRLARVLTGEAPLAVLDSWEEWQRASTGPVH